MVNYPTLHLPVRNHYNVELTIREIHDFVRFPRSIFIGRIFPWKIIEYYQDPRHPNDILYCNEGFNKTGYIRMHPGGGFIYVMFLPACEKNPPPAIIAALILVRFAYFVKKHIDAIGFNPTLEF